MMKKVNNSTITLRNSDKHTIIDGVDQGAFSGTHLGFICPFFYASFENNLIFYYGTGGTIMSSSTENMTITVNNSTVSVVFGTFSITHNNVNLSMAYCTIDPDYCVSQSSGIIDVYLNDKTDVIMITQSPLGIYNYDKWRGITSTTVTDADLIGIGTPFANGVTRYFMQNTSIGYNIIVCYPISVKSTPT